MVGITQKTGFVVVVGGSAGGIESAGTVIGSLPEDFNAPLFLVIHIPPALSILPEILARRALLPVAHAVDLESVARGHVYVAPSDRHMRVEDGRVRLNRGPRENRFRPAIDPLFRSAAETFGSRAIGVVLSGALDDGAAGLYAIKEAGGIAVVQDPKDAAYPGMPEAALRLVTADYVLPAGEIGPLLTGLVARPPSEPSPEKLSKAREVVVQEEQGGNVSPFTCPECHGTLWEVKRGSLQQFRCRIGHAFSPESLIQAQDDDLENSLWAAVRSLEENGAMLAKLAEEAQAHKHAGVAQRFRERAQEKQRHADIIKSVLTNPREHGAAPPVMQPPSQEKH